MFKSSGDLLISVVKAADPVKYKESFAKLQKAKESVLSKTEFISTMVTNKRSLYSGSNTVVSPVYKKFEGSVLKSFVGNMFTSNSSHVYGSGTAGRMWQSMLSDEVAKEMTSAGGIGIAKMLQDRAQHVIPPMDNVTGSNNSM